MKSGRKKCPECEGQLETMSHSLWSLSFSFPLLPSILNSFLPYSSFLPSLPASHGAKLQHCSCMPSLLDFALAPALFLFPQSMGGEGGQGWNVFCTQLPPILREENSLRRTSQISILRPVTSGGVRGGPGQPPASLSAKGVHQVLNGGLRLRNTL